jgi:hypothetical protein
LRAEKGRTKSKSGAAMVWLWTGPSSRLNQTVLLFKFLNNRRQQWLQPDQQMTCGRVADTQPLGKVFVFGDDHRAVFLGVPPDWSILALGEIEIQNVLGLMPFFPQPSGQGGGQLRVNEEAHTLRRLPTPDN